MRRVLIRDWKSTVSFLLTQFVFDMLTDTKSLKLRLNNKHGKIHWL